MLDIYARSHEMHDVLQLHSRLPTYSIIHSALKQNGICKFWCFSDRFTHPFCFQMTPGQPFSFQMTNPIIHSALKSKTGETVLVHFDALDRLSPIQLRNRRQGKLCVMDKPAYGRLVERGRPENKLLVQVTCQQCTCSKENFRKSIWHSDATFIQ
jgi:hypothetical protein